jgi:Ca2+-binding RTX toxin-like protein
LISSQPIGVWSAGFNNATTSNNGIVISAYGQNYFFDARPDSVVLNPDGTPSSGYNSHEVLVGTAYSDYIDGGDGDDTIYGGAGNDLLMGGAGADHVYGEAGNDTIYGGTLPDFIDGGDGNDIIHGGDDVDVLIGGDGNDRIYGDANIDELHGDAGNDYLDGGSEADVIFGGLGCDIAIGGEGVDVVDGQWGDDILYGGPGPDQLFGGYGDDILHGGTGAGNLTLNVDECLGEIGFDIVSFSDIVSPLNLVADLNFQNINQVGQQTQLVTPFGQLWVQVEGIEGGNNADQIIGDLSGNWLIGGNGNDIISGGGGDDLLIGDSIKLSALDGTIVDGVLQSNGILDLVNVAGGKHFTELLAAYPDFTFGVNSSLGTNDIQYSTSTPGFDTATYAGAFSNFIVRPVFQNNTIVGIRIVDTTGAETTTIGDLAIGIDQFVFGYDFESNVATNHTPVNAASVVGTTFSYNQLIYNPLPTSNFAVLGVAAENGVGGPHQQNVLTSNISSLMSDFHITNYSVSWQKLLPGATSWSTIAGQTGNSLALPTGAYAQGTTFREVVTFVALNGVQYTVYSDPTAPMGKEIFGDPINGTTLTGTRYQDVIYGGNGADTINGGIGADVLIGGGGNDTYTVDNVGDVIVETISGGTDSVNSSVSYILSSNVENLTLTGTAAINATGNDLSNILTGNSGINILTGGAGNDTLDGKGGADSMIGGLGDDLYFVDNINDTILENPSEGIDSVRSTVTYTLSANVENLTLLNTAALNATGNELANLIIGNSGNNIIAGLGGADTIDGGLGVDTVTYAASMSGVNVSLAPGFINTGGDAEGDILLNMENITGSGYDDIIEGDANANVLNGGAGTDLVSYAHASAGVTVNLALTTAQNTVGAGSDKISNFEGIIGSPFADTLLGTSANNILLGGAGNDVLNGLGGIDTLDGGDGSDLYLIATAADHPSAEISDTGTGIGDIDELRFTATAAGTLVLYAGDLGLEKIVVGTGTAAVAVTTATTAINVNAALLTYGVSIIGNAGTNVLTGGQGNDILDGNAGNDTLVGGAGNDTLIGGLGVDTLSGGIGADSFVFNTALNATTNKDTIADFSSSEGDKIALSKAIFTALSGTIGNSITSGDFYAGAGVSSSHLASDRILYNSTTGALYYDADGTGATAAIQFAVLGTTTHPALTYNDFQIIA